MCMESSSNASIRQGRAGIAAQRSVGSAYTAFKPGEYSRITAMPNYTAMALGRGSYTGPTRIERETRTVNSQADLDALNGNGGPLTKQWRRTDGSGPSTETAYRQDRVAIADEGSARRRTRGARAAQQTRQGNSRLQAKRGGSLRINSVGAQASSTGSGLNVPT